MPNNRLGFDANKLDNRTFVLLRAIEQSPVSILITNPKGDIEYVNPKFSAVTGYSFEEAMGNNPRILKSGKMPVEVYRELWNAILQGKEWRGELENKKKNGDFFWEMASISGIKNDSGQLTHFVAVKEDITERKMHEEEIEEKNNLLQEINAQKDKLFSILAHDLRGPFNGFLGLTEMMAEESTNMEPDEMREIARSMRHSALNIFDLLSNLLEWSRLQQGILKVNLEANNFVDLIDDTIGPFFDMARQKNIELKVNCPKNIVVYSDYYVLQTVIRNLLSNAIKFTHKGGLIVFDAYVDTDKKNLVCSVSDSGIGMSPDVVDNLFRIDVNTSRLGTDKEPSSGLGLILCKEFVEKHRGELSVSSKINEGSIFSFTIPLANNG
jgi:PAS domain S-box-containing protein